MIPRHSLPFSLRRIMSVMVSPTLNMHSSDIEKAYADVLGVCSVILLPSVRAGIQMVIQAASGPGTIAVGPAYTCHTVHEAMALSSTSSRLIDSATGAFLMPSDGICAAVEPGCALVVSEVYGIPYAQESLQKACGKGLSVQIFDMAMSIPSPKRMQQLGTRDVALFSFGWGKPMYAGWGGIACFQDFELANRVRKIRDQWITQESLGLQFQRTCSTVLRVAMNQRILYGLTHEPHFYRLFRKASSHEQGCQSKNSGSLPPQWTSPMTALNRKLSLLNLRNAVRDAELRHIQAEIYSRSLVESGIVHGPGSNSLPQSHFPIRLPSAVRNAMCDYLRSRGIDTSTLFALPAGLSRDHYPHAAEAADEVITLPMGPAITLDEVRMVSRCIKDGLQALAC